MSGTSVRTLRLPLSPYMNRHEVATYLRCHPNSVDKLARDGLLTKHRIRGMSSLLYLRSEVIGIVFEDDDVAETANGARQEEGTTPDPKDRPAERRSGTADAQEPTS